MSHIVYEPEKSIFRYAAGTPIYSERLEDGALIMENFRGHGLPLAEEWRSHQYRPTPSFRLEVDGCDVRYGWEMQEFHKTQNPDGRARGELVLRSTRKKLLLRVVTLCGEDGMMTRELSVKNLSDTPVAISRCAPLCGVLWEDWDSVGAYVTGYDDTPFYVGGFADHFWGREGEFTWNAVPLNRSVSFGSHNGKSGHGHPFAILKNTLYGGYFLCQMEWSTDWEFRFHADCCFWEGPGVRMTYELSPDTEAPMRILELGEELALPAVHFGLFYESLDRSIQALHSYQRSYLLAKPYGMQELFSYDGWGYHGSDYQEDILFREIDRAADLGAELYMVDAGWYGRPGTEWANTVGDWDTCRLPHDLNPIIDYVHQKGMKFGLWVEPESAGDRSELAKRHPEWFAAYHGKTVGRVLDLSNPAVEAWISEQLTDIVRRYGIDLLRLDFNNTSINGTRQNGAFEENMLWRYTEALYRIFDRLHEEFPSLMLENCGGGGGRTDLGMMRRFSKTQFSDWYRLPRGAKTLNGMTLCLPPECLLIQYGSALDADNTGSAEMQVQLLVLGVPKISGIAPIEEEVSPDMWELLQKYLRIYKEFIRPMQRSALCFHHTPKLGGSDGKGWMAIEFAAPGGEKAYLFAARLPGTEDSRYLLKPRGLKKHKTYTVTLCADGETYTVSGAELLKTGLEITREMPLTSELVLVEETSGCVR